MKMIISLAALAASLCSPALAQEAKPSLEISGNATAATDYRFRGISQTRLRPALQAGVDLAHAGSGLYAGAWASNVSWAKDAGGGGSSEIDLYAGIRGSAPLGSSYDVGAIAYRYPGNGLGRVPGFVDADTVEAYAQLSRGPYSIKYSRSATTLFGFPDSHGSGYLDATANFDIGRGATLSLHAGRQRVANNPAASYSDWKVGVAKDLGLATVSLAVVGTNADKAAYASPANGKFLGKTSLVLSAAKTF
jgi:uncharacterized protein (TIGR02001 family)